MATITLASNASLSQTLAYETNGNHLRDASFSSYLNSTEESLVLKLTESAMKPPVTITTPQEAIYQVSSGRKKNGYGEISVFGAEKYFSGVMDEEETRIANKNAKKHPHKKDGKVDIHGTKPKTKMGTPSTCSEASWNSRSALLPAIQTKQDKVNGKSFFATFGCNCYCSDKKSVDVDENIADNKSCSNSKKDIDCGEIKGKVMAKVPLEIVKQDSNDKIKQTTAPSWFKEEISCNKLDIGGNAVQYEDCFTLPISNSSGGNLPLEKKLTLEEEKARKSLEVFGSPIMEKEDIALSLEKKLAMLTWDANPTVVNPPVVPVIRSTEPNDDIDSDSSSDLFEIKSLSSHGHPFFKRQTSDGMSSCMSPSCYEPSEASIDWSVVTASAANFSVATDYEERNQITSAKNFDTPTTGAKTTTTSGKIETRKDVPKRRASTLLGCRSQKAVKVAGGAHKMPETKPEFRRYKSNSFSPMSRFQAENKVTDLESAHAQRAFSTGSLSQLHSARAKDAIYMT
ncbi:hypothetical protein IFM89_001251 [Coptis chinensis]|uniref:Phytochrome kinase substrate 1 n=1 Tax=Coptis chinensis TaxID=261450 RepID=A0A835LKV7_9MAGN|nr:hypothetical protein IFM89_001251 [Coptis chinensis]